jgi:hypothetical protein
MAMCVIAPWGDAARQCFSPGSILTMSPGKDILDRAAISQRRTPPCSAI